MKRLSFLPAVIPILVALPVAAQTAPPAANQCRACHATQKGAPNGIGPNLNGVYGRQAGSAPGFAYSPAMKASKLRWDDRTLDEFLASPMKKVPGSRMPISVADPAKRAALIAWLKGFSGK